MALLAAVATSGAGGAAPPRQRPMQADIVVRTLSDLERALATGRADDFRALAARSLPDEDRQRFAFAVRGGPPATAVIRERARRPGPTGFDVLADVLVGYAQRGRIATWSLTIAPAAASPDRGEIVRLGEVAAVDGLVRLALDRTRQFTVANVVVRAPDITLTLTAGTAFVTETAAGVTAMTFRGRGAVAFAPPDAAEQGQLRLFAGAPVLETTFDAAFFRFNAAEFASRVTTAGLTPGPARPADVARADEIFRDRAGKAYNVDVGALTPDRWSLEPPGGGLVADFNTRRHGWLTYARSPGEPEDVSVVDRARGRTIAVYPSAERVAERGRSFNEDDGVVYDVQHHAIDLAFDPARLWVSGRSRLTVRVAAPLTGTFVLRLAQPLAITAVSSPALGELLALRVVGQSSVIVGLSSVVARGTDVTLDVAYNGRLDPQALDREAIDPSADVPQQEPPAEVPMILPEPRFLYSNRVYWYPQAEISDYATASLRLTVPAAYQVVASGTLVESALVRDDGGPREAAGAFVRRVEYLADRPVRYLSCVISRFLPGGRQRVPMPAVAPPSPSAGATTGTPEALALEVVATPRTGGRSRAAAPRVAAMLGYFASLIGEAPYPDFTLAILDDNLPGGHSPAYFAVFHQPLPTTPYSWASDPVSLEPVYAHFFLAHEVAHQWWGQAVGWKNYHEQWLSEGLAQYFAALYAGADRGSALVDELVERMRASAEPQLSQGPISLGYRLGHLKSDSRVFRALVYNKAAVVLHMLRRLAGDEAFFRALGRYYRAARFRKAGTDELRAAVEAETGRSWARFFERWIHGTSVPRVRVGWRPGGAADRIVITIEQVGEVFDVPLRLGVHDVGGRTSAVEVGLREPIAELTVPVAGPIARVSVQDPLVFVRTVR
jgi:hypothetical protein